MSQLCLEAGQFVARKAPTALLSESASCPAILSRFSWMGTAAERRIECCTGERETALAAHRFVPCDGHRAPKLGAVLTALRGRTVALVGDSTLLQLWTALLAELYHLPATLEITQRVLEYDIRPENHNQDAMCTISHSRPPRQGGSVNRFRFDARASPYPCNLTSHRGGPSASRWPLLAECHALPDLEMMVPEADVQFLFYRVDANSTKSVRPAFKHASRCRTRERLFNAKIEAAMKAADVVLANIGVWYGSGAEWDRKYPGRTSARYAADVQHVLARLATLAPQGKLGLWRESTPQHFPSQSGSGLYEERDKGMDGAFTAGKAAKAGKKRGGTGGCLGACPALGPEWASKLDWRNEVASGLAASVGLPSEAIVPVASILRPMQAVHKPTKWACGLDCTHYCYHPHLWSALLDGLYRRWYRWVRATSLPLTPREQRAALLRSPDGDEGIEAPSPIAGAAGPRQPLAKGRGVAGGAKGKAKGRGRERLKSAGDGSVPVGSRNIRG